jgi:hypothetical protein
VADITPSVQLPGHTRGHISYGQEIHAHKYVGRMRIGNSSIYLLLSKFTE